METRGLSLDEIDRVFEIKHAPGSKITYKEATRLAKEEIEAEKLRIQSGSEKGDVNFVESSSTSGEKV